MATVTREQLQKALSSLSALEGMASGYCELQDGFDTSKGIAENVRQLLAALASPPAEDEHALPTKADAWSLHAYVVDHAADHDDDCPGDDTCDCQFRARNEAVSRCVRWLIERPRAPQAPPASDPPRLGCESPSNCDPKLDLCTRCQARTAPNGLTPPSWITARQSDPPGLVELVAALKAAANRRKGRPHGVARVSAEYEEALAYEALLAYPLPASPQAETTKGDR